ncbi:MAG TPA: carboxypeptidase regulatory-like domain-containing protein [Candidatus Nitrosotenuis sp.]|nr:carboxypeptidase regulatory-like domain-containing protein [Candidatus Nitrosotenuis sp.]
MKPWVCIFALLFASSAWAQSLTLNLQQKGQVPAIGATAAIPLDASCVDVQLEKDVLTVLGKRPCSTKVMIISAENALSLDVQVVARNVLRDAASGKSGSGAFADTGSFSFRYQSGPSRFENSFEFTRRQGERTVRFQLTASTTPFGSGNAGPVSLNVMSYQIISSRQELTFLDRPVDSSPLTVNGMMVRGVHLRRGDWFAHGGFTSPGSYQDLFFPVQRELVFGVGRRLRLGKHTTLTPMLFYFSGDKLNSRASKSGAVGSLLFEHQPSSRLRFVGELGFSRGVAAYFQTNYQGRSDEIVGRVRLEPGNFPSLRANNRHGFYSDVRWTHSFSRTLRANLYVSANRFLLPGFEQSNFITNLQLQYTFARVWNVQGGWDFSSFHTRVPASSKMRTVSAPVSLGLYARHFGGTILYRFSRNAPNELGSHQWRESAYARWRGFQVGVFHDRQTMAPTVDLILSQFPALEQALLQEGLTATSPQQIAALLRENSALLNLGLIEGVNIFLSPRRTQYGGNVNWTAQGARRQQFQYSVLFNKSEGLRAAMMTTIHRASYTFQLSSASEFYVSASWLQSRSAGNARNLRPIVSFGFRRKFDAAPAFLMPGKKGIITGRVFVDKEQRGAYQAGAELVANAEVVLDGSRRTRTDKEGRFWFKGVAQGAHEVEVNLKHERPFYFTTPSRVETDINSEVNFGISFERSRLFGRVVNDAGAGIYGVVLRVRNAEFSFDSSTTGDGSFQFAGLPDGEFEVQLVSDSVPAGYRVEDTSAQRVRLHAGAPVSVEFRLQAMRSVSGKVILRPRPSSRPAPVPGARVRIRELNLECTADENGAYLFRNLPAGNFTLVVQHEKREVARTLTIPANPVSIKNFDLHLADSNNLQISMRHTETSVQRITP